METQKQTAPKIQHTAGEWKVEIDDYNTFKFQLTSIINGRTHVPTKEESKANAKLIAAAPELLEALKELLEVCPCQNGCAENDMTCATQKAKSIINKATK